ncbi:hypothetical protein HPP92_001644 [Vanilla planifolia]|uniref:Uncharacterized protein n=1 Tax=Vanilla planifolia TaxID=51239 RepID=A0A835S3T7_VANPL|nr:hypothetical protein HPP92_001644 [Vanilla planifolia]
MGFKQRKYTGAGFLEIHTFLSKLYPAIKLPLLLLELSSFGAAFLPPLIRFNESVSTSKAKASPISCLRIGKKMLEGLRSTVEKEQSTAAAAASALFVA